MANVACLWNLNFCYCFHGTLSGFSFKFSEIFFMFHNFSYKSFGGFPYISQFSSHALFSVFPGSFVLVFFHFFHAPIGCSFFHFSFVSISFTNPLLLLSFSSEILQLPPYSQSPHLSSDTTFWTHKRRQTFPPDAITFPQNHIMLTFRCSRWRQRWQQHQRRQHTITQKQKNKKSWSQTHRQLFIGLSCEFGQCCQRRITTRNHVVCLPSR